MTKFTLSYGTYAILILDDNGRLFIETYQWVIDHFEPLLIEIPRVA